ncbi:MAG: DUF177 domain-containing protein [Actinobacteria bacterium]|nr:DUF177 domain-containing protein [Actinomycetota bacterium]
MTAGHRGVPEGVVDLRRLDLAPGAGAQVDVRVALGDVTLGGQPYAPDPRVVDVRLDMGSSGSGLGMRLRFATTLTGPCQRCLAPSAFGVEVDARDFQASGRTDADEPDDDLDCEYLSGPLRMEIDVTEWARDAVAEVLPMSILCRDDCAGLCARCGADRNAAPCACADDEMDPRWAALGELKERLGDSGDAAE